MQDRYAGDVGDFGKYGVLRVLAGRDRDARRLRLGIIWYLTEEKGQRGDGQHVGYLVRSLSNERRFRACDATLYDAMATLVHGRRSVSRISTLEIFATDTVFFHEPTPRAVDDPTRVERESSRRQWAQRAFDAVRECPVVFVDPDNGLAPDSVETHHRRARKYAFLDEVRVGLRRSQSLVIYQHLGRHGSALEQIREHLRVLSDRFFHRPSPWGLWFRRGTSRVFLVVPNTRHARLLRTRRDSLMGGPWGQFGHFE